jgi:hypothetical protein
VAVRLAGDGEALDLEELRLRAGRRRLIAEDFADCRLEPIIHEPLECLPRLPNVVDVPAVLRRDGAVEDQPFGELIGRRRRLPNIFSFTWSYCCFVTPCSMRENLRWGYGESPVNWIKLGSRVSPSTVRRLLACAARAGAAQWRNELVAVSSPAGGEHARL